MDKINLLTDLEINQNSDIPTEEILDDIADTKKEIKDFQDEKDVLMRNPVNNKVRIYLLEGRISSRQGFVDKLQQIIDYRKQNDK